MIKAIIFDFDGMVYHTSERFSDRLIADYEVDEDNIISFFRHELPLCQKGKLDMEEVLSEYLPSWNVPLNMEDLFKYWFEDGYLDRKILLMIEKLKSAGTICGLVTNNEYHRYQYMKETLKVEDLFDIVVASWRVHACKPDPKIYKKFLELSSLEAGEVLVYDDKEKNIAKIKELGFVCRTYRGIDSFKQDLQELGVKMA